MLKRTKGRILLTLLVITGLAGTINNTSLSTKERKLAVGALKDSRNDLLITIKDLSASQLDFRLAGQELSIRDCFYHLIATEQTMWTRLQSSMEQPAHPEKRAELKIPDDGSMILSLSQDHLVSDPIESSRPGWKSMSEAVTAFKALRMQPLKFVKTTTSDLRNRFIKVPSGWIDCYQYIFYIAQNSARHLALIDEILSHPSFPDK